MLYFIKEFYQRHVVNAQAPPENLFLTEDQQYVDSDTSSEYQAFIEQTVFISDNAPLVFRVEKSQVGNEKPPQPLFNDHK